MQGVENGEDVPKAATTNKLGRLYRLENPCELRGVNGTRLDVVGFPTIADCIQGLACGRGVGESGRQQIFALHIFRWQLIQFRMIAISVKIKCRWRKANECRVGSVWVFVSIIA